jgi:hypothetical protein
LVDRHSRMITVVDWAAGHVSAQQPRTI